MTRVAVLDDYQDVVLRMADWNVLPSDSNDDIAVDFARRHPRSRVSTR
jgi:hypothetical protein